MRRDFIGGLLAGSILGLTLAASFTGNKESRKMIKREGNKARKKFLRIMDDINDMWK